MRERTISRDSGRASCVYAPGARKRWREIDPLPPSPDPHTLETTRSPTRQRHRFFPEKRPKRDLRAVVTPQTAQRAGNHQPRPPRRKGKKEESDPPASAAKPGATSFRSQAGPADSRQMGRVEREFVWTKIIVIITTAIIDPRGIRNGNFSHHFPPSFSRSEPGERRRIWIFGGFPFLSFPFLAFFLISATFHSPR
jgi:hypothetical protein